MHKFWLKSDWQLWGQITLLVLSCRALFMGIAFEFIRHEKGSNQDFWSMFSSIFSKAGDSSLYLHIAEFGYEATGEYAKLIVFYPLYPFLIRIMHLVVGDYFIAGILVSILSLIAASWYIYSLLRDEYDNITALRGVLLVQLYPFSVFLNGVYTESLFIFLTAVVFYYVRKGRWKIVALAAFLASLTRTQGVVLFFPVVYEYCLARQLFHAPSFSSFLKRLNKDMLAIACIPMGYFGYLLLNKIVQDDWFAFVTHLKAPPWWQGADWIGNNIAQHYSMSQDYFSLGFFIYWPQIIGFFASLALLYWALKNRLRTSWVIFGLASMALSYTASWLISGPRYLLGNLPLFLLLSVFIQHDIKRLAVYSIFAFFLIFYTVSFWQGQAIM